MSDERQYTVTWAYTTFAQDMTPQEAADLAVSVFTTGTDPCAPAGFVEVTVSEHGAGYETNLGEYMALVVDPQGDACPACNAEPGEDCRPDCIGKAQHDHAAESAAMRAEDERRNYPDEYDEGEAPLCGCGARHAVHVD